MPLAITLTADLKEHKKELVKRFDQRVRNGFQNKGGHFYKKLGDPRNITDELIKTKIITLPQFSEKPIGQSNKNTETIYVPFRIDFDEFRLKVKWKVMSVSNNGERTTIEECRIEGMPWMPQEIKNTHKFIKIEYYKNNDTIRFWISDAKKENADYVLYGSTAHRS